MTSLLELALSADSHVLILGSSGAGKTTLIREMLSVFTSDDYVVLVFDPAQLYENYCDIHAPLPVSLLEVRDKLVDILCEALSTRYRTDRYTLSPLMEELLHRVLTSPTVTSLRDVVEELDRIARESPREDVTLSALALKRRLRFLSFWLFEHTHKILDKVRRGALRGLVIGLDTSFLDDVQRLVYVLSVIELTQRAPQGIIYVIDEAHLLLRLAPRLLLQYMRLGRNLRKIYVLSTHSKHDVPSQLLDIVRVIVEFPSLDSETLLPTGVARVRVLSRRGVTQQLFVQVDYAHSVRQRLRLSFRKILRELASHGQASVQELLQKSVRDSSTRRLIEQALAQLDVH